jgi:cytoskeletal protein CcmA (bactofilin family)
MWDRNNKVEPLKHEPGVPIPPPVSAAQPEPRTGVTIGKSVKIIGDVFSGEDLFIDGEVQGTIEAKQCRLTIGMNGKVKSNMRAREVVIQGQVQGNVEASQKIIIRKEGSLVGNIKTAGIVIDDDAYFKGSIDIVRVPKEQPESAWNDDSPHPAPSRNHAVSTTDRQADSPAPARMNAGG